MKEMSVAEIRECFEKGDFDTYALRGDNYIPETSFRNSWYHGDDEGEFELDGVSAIKIMDITKIDQYIASARGYGKNVFLLAGECVNAHPIYNDPGEVLMTEYEIIGIVK